MWFSINKNVIDIVLDISVLQTYIQNWRIQYIRQKDIFQLMKPHTGSSWDSHVHLILRVISFTSHLYLCSSLIDHVVFTSSSSHLSEAHSEQHWSLFMTVVSNNHERTLKGGVSMFPAFSGETIYSHYTPITPLYSRLRGNYKYSTHFLRVALEIASDALSITDGRTSGWSCPTWRLDALNGHSSSAHSSLSSLQHSCI